jgi:hypothetical protein
MKLRVSEGTFEWNGSVVSYVEYISGAEVSGSQMRRVEVTYQEKTYEVEYDAFLEVMREKVIEMISN